MPGPDTISRNSRRSPRYRIVAPVRYCVGDATDWFEATTVNMGDRGVLVRTQHLAPPPATAVRLRVRLVAGGSAGSDVACCGHVVWGDPQPTGDVLFAVSIDSYHFERRPLIPSSCGSLRPENMTEADGDPVGGRSRQES